MGFPRRTSAAISPASDPRPIRRRWRDRSEVAPIMRNSPDRLRSPGVIATMNIVEPIGIRGRRMRPAFTIAIVLVLGLVAELAWTLSSLGEAQDAHWAKEA